MPSTEKKPQSELISVIDKFLDEKNSGKSEDSVEFLSIIDFIERFKLLPSGLYPVQKFILKLYYGVPLNSTDKIIKVTDKFNTRVIYEFTEVEYLKFLYDSGRCNIEKQDNIIRHELILVLGRRAGKCSDIKTSITTSNGLFTFEELLNQCGVDRSKTGWHDLDIDIVQQNSKRAKATGLYYGGFQKTKRIYTHCGYKANITPEHRIKVINEFGDIVWKYGSEICVGDYIGINRLCQLWPEKFLNVSDLVPKYSKYSKKERIRNLKKGFRVYPRGVWKDFVDCDLAEFLGILVGDGTWSSGKYKGKITVTGGCEEFRSYVEEIFTKYFGSFNMKRKKFIKTTCEIGPWDVGVGSVKDRKFLDLIGFRLNATKSTKSVPWVIFKSPKVVVAAFLRGLFEADGGVEKAQAITFSSHSKKLCEDVQDLLLNFGIVCSIRPKKNKRYNTINYKLALLGGRSKMIFANEIGFITKRKIELLNQAISRVTSGCSDTESIPNLKQKLRALRESIPKSKNGVAGSPFPCRARSGIKELLGGCVKPGVNENISYCRLQSVVKFAERNGASSSLCNDLKQILDADYFWDPVISVNDDFTEVADLSVPDGESYTAGGMVNHNSSLASIIAAYEIYKLLRRGTPQSYYGIPHNSEIRVMCVANDKEQASIVYSDMSGYVDNVDYFKSSVTNQTQTFMKFQTDNDRKRYGKGGRSTITATFKSSIAKGLRGRGIICYILDEIAFFVNTGNSSAEQVYRAINPSIAQFSPKDPKNKHRALGPSDGRAILISSPDAKDGFFYSQYMRSLSGGVASSNMLMIQAPTWEVNPTLDRSYYEIEFNKNPKSFITEHGAEFSDRVRGWIENKKDLLDCINPNLKPITRGAIKEFFWAGVDFGIVKDGTAISLFHFVNGKIELAYHEVWYAGRDWYESNPHLTSPLTEYAKNLKDVSRLDVTEIAEWFKVLSTRFYIEKGVFDQWAGPIFEQELHKRGLKQFEMKNFSVVDSSHVYHTAKMCMLSGQLSIYDYPKPVKLDSDSSVIKHSPLITELLELQATSGGKNITIVEAPRVSDKHDDMSDSFVRSIYLAVEFMREHPGAMEASSRSSNPFIQTPSQSSYHRYHSMRNRLHGTTDRNKHSSRVLVRR